MEIAPTLSTPSGDFTLVSKRPNEGAVYVNSDRSQYLRYGPVSDLSRELGSHRAFEAQGAPVPEVSVIQFDKDPGYYIERSLGDKNYTQRFHTESEASGTAADDTFTAYLDCASTFLRQQQTAEPIAPDWTRLKQFVRYYELAEAAPALQPLMQPAWQKLMAELGDVDWVLTHGDFTSSNVFDRGVTDFETSGPMPYGYDIHTGVNSVYWFPLTLDYERSKPYGLAERHVNQYLERFGTLMQQRTGHSYRELFGAYQVLRGMWLTAASSNSKPRVKVWRQQTMHELLTRYLNDDELHDWWFARQTGYPIRGRVCNYCLV